MGKGPSQSGWQLHLITKYFLIMGIIFWIFVFIASLALLVKSADWLVESAEKIGLVLKISPFIIGVTIVAIGTSLPELASSLSAVLKGVSEVVPANVIGSNIANILLIVGLSAIAARRLIVRRSLIDLDAPLLAASTILFIFIAWDRKIEFKEGILLLIGFVIYVLYTIFQRREQENEAAKEVLPSRVERREKEARIEKEKESIARIDFKTIFFLLVGIVGLAIGADYTIESVVKISEILKIAPSLIAISAIALGTSLPELVTSVQAALKKKYEISLGNIFGSNVFNILLVTGIPTLIAPLRVNSETFTVGIPFLIIATFLFIISGISQRIHIWEGAMYVLLYILFVAKLFNLF